MVTSSETLSEIVQDENLTVQFGVPLKVTMGSSFYKVLVNKMSLNL